MKIVLDYNSRIGQIYLINSIHICTINTFFLKINL